MLKINDEILKFICEVQVRDEARYLTREEANRRYCRKSKNPENENISGFHFDLTTIKKFIHDIDKFNESKIIGDDGTERFRNHDEIICGIRIWKAKSWATIKNPETEVVVAEGNADDIIITPALHNQSDIHASKLGDSALGDSENLLILGNGQPCPNLCVGSPIDFFHEYKGHECPDVFDS